MDSAVGQNAPVETAQMHQRHGPFLACAVLSWFVFSMGCNERNRTLEEVAGANVTLILNDATKRNALAIHAGEPIRPLSPSTGSSPEKVMLGRLLFHDKRLSKDNSVSCASCHNIAEGGDDGLPTAVGIRNQVGSLNTPTVLNSSLSIAQFWDGRAKTLRDQASEPVHNPIEMDTNWDEVIEKLSRDRELVRKFQNLNGSGITKDTILDCIVAYESALVTVDSPFDLYLCGTSDEISEEALAGYSVFKSIGCVSCHQGSAVGGNMFQEFGVMRSFNENFGVDHDANPVHDPNKGRINVTEREIDLHRFKVPSLRNVELTAPYFHDGSSPTLKNAIKTMADFQLGMSLTETELSQVEAFLNSLTGRLPRYLK